MRDGVDFSPRLVVTRITCCTRSRSRHRTGRPQRLRLHRVAARLCVVAGQGQHESLEGTKQGWTYRAHFGETAGAGDNAWGRRRTGLYKLATGSGWRSVTRDGRGGVGAGHNEIAVFVIVSLGIAVVLHVAGERLIVLEHADAAALWKKVLEQ